MKFPLHPRPFAPLQISPHQRIEYEATAMAVLRETLDEYHHYVHAQHRTVNPRQWKALKTKENVTAYKQKHQDTRHQRHSVATATRQWPLPKLLVVGTLTGTLEDVMYGSMSIDSDSLRMRMAYMDPELCDGEVLHNFTLPTRADPFQSLGIQWFVKAPPNAGTAAVINPRDMVNLRATGLVVDPATGDHLGYQVLHSIELRECPPLTALGILRGAFSSCFLFKQLKNGTVEMYKTAYFDIGGNIPVSLATMRCANGLMDTGKAVWCAQNKKLAWLLTDALSKRGGSSSGGSATVKTNDKNRQCCSLCSHSISTFRRAVVCELCRAVVCSRCRTVRKLTYVDERGVVELANVFCATCITVASTTSAAEISRHEYVYGKTWDDESTLSRDTELVSDVDTVDSGWQGKQLPQRPTEDILTIMSAAVAEIEDGIAVEHEYGGEQEVESGAPVGTPHQELQRQQQYALWLQMSQLRLQVEEAYETARSNTQVMMMQASQARP